VVTAANGEQALHSFSVEHPDLILLDVEMPFLDGFEVARCIRGETAGKRVPIIFLSGQSEPAMIAAGIDAGGDDYLIKPVSLKVLLAKIEALRRITELYQPSSSGLCSDPPTTTASSIEIRWFFPATAADRRPALCNDVVPARRTDRYAAPGHCGCGIKLRNERLEMKLRRKSLGQLTLPAAAGDLEQWDKWSLPLTVAPALADLQTSGWIAVEKNRFRIYFSLGPAGIYQLDQPPDSGYQLEWCELEVNGQRWLTVGLESLGDSAVLAQHFSSVK
jgi:CheY-like chemotaxis protein